VSFGSALYMSMVERMLGRVGERRMKRVSTNEGKRRKMKREIETEGRPQSAKYFHFVSIWLLSGILLTGQSRISRIDSSTIPVTALFSSSTVKHFMGPILHGFRNLHQLRKFIDSVCHSRVGICDIILHDYTNALFAYIIYFQAGRYGQVE
jgi:hypothetical protein